MCDNSAGHCNFSDPNGDLEWDRNSNGLKQQCLVQLDPTTTENEKSGGPRAAIVDLGVLLGEEKEQEEA